MGWLGMYIVYVDKSWNKTLSQLIAGKDKKRKYVNNENSISDMIWYSNEHTCHIFITFLNIVDEVYSVLTCFAINCGGWEEFVCIW